MDDDRFPAGAPAAQANPIVNGGRKSLTIPGYRGVTVSTLREFWSLAHEVFDKTTKHCPPVGF